MKKLLIPIFSVAMLSMAFTSVQAQSTDKISISFGPEFAAPFHSTFGSYESDGYYENGGGFSALMELPIVPRVKFTFSAGYFFYGNDDEYTSVPTCEACTVPTGQIARPLYEYVPLKAGLRYYYIKYLYVGGELGEAIKADDLATNSFIYGGGLGGYVPFGLHSAIDLSANFERGYKSVNYDYPLSQVLIRLAYKYRF